MSQAFRYLMEGRESNERADIVAVHLSSAYVFELKVDESADTVLVQAKSKAMTRPYHNGNAPIWLIGISFDNKTHISSLGG